MASAASANQGNAPGTQQEEEGGALEPVTREEYLRFRRAVIKRLKKLDEQVSDAFQAISDLEDKQNELIDEALDRSNRAQRAVRRLQKEIEE